MTGRGEKGLLNIFSINIFEELACYQKFFVILYYKDFLTANKTTKYLDDE